MVGRLSLEGHTMKLGFMLGYSGAALDVDVAKVQEAERLGYDSVWTAEAWGSDAVTPLAWIGAHTSRIKLGTAIMQLPGRSPANTAMTAMTLDALSGGRFILGLGTSGPQVVEGWHGRPFHKPLSWLREYVTIVRMILERKAPLVFEGEHYQIPYERPDSTGQGKP
jgi:alkanesulfonate monooxygenase SsuD/methylene tetrahydromethanopterin reductase-like flavin-dependent oxidoreductase (luciferase family)